MPAAMNQQRLQHGRDRGPGARGRSRRCAVVCLWLCLGWCAALAGCDLAHEDPVAAADVRPPAEAALPVDLQDLPPNKHGELVRQGYQVFTNTPGQARRFSGSALSCSNCHLDAGKRANAAPMWAAWGMYPAYLAKNDRVTTLEERIQQCFRFSLNGFPPPLDSHEMRALTTYMQWLARGYPVGVELPGRGFPSVPRTGADPDPLRGKGLYARRCANCHGKNGEGLRTVTGSYVFPPLWGHASFNKGAGLNRIDLLAGFLKANMPLGNANLSDQESLDIAAWVTLQERWPDPRKGWVSGLVDR